jgi:hypothetical protein
MNSKLRTQVFTMAVAALGLGAAACGKKAEPVAPEAPAAASGAEGELPAEGTPGSEAAAPAAEEGSKEAGGESACGGASCGTTGGK